MYINAGRWEAAHRVAVGYLPEERTKVWVDAWNYELRIFSYINKWQRNCRDKVKQEAPRLGFIRTGICLGFAFILWPVLILAALA